MNNTHVSAVLGWIAFFLALTVLPIIVAGLLGGVVYVIAYAVFNNEQVTEDLKDVKKLSKTPNCRVSLQELQDLLKNTLDTPLDLPIDIEDLDDQQTAYAFRLMKTDYLKSTMWDTKRKAVLKRDNYVCQRCGATDVALDVHHIMYKNVPSETEKDLVALCRTCHTNTHEAYGYPNTHQEYMDFNADPRN